MSAVGTKYCNINIVDRQLYQLKYQNVLLEFELCLPQ